MHSGEFLKNKRLEKNLSLRQLAYKTGLSHTYIADIEKGNLLGTEDTRGKIIVALTLSEKEIEDFYKLLLRDENFPNYVQKKIDDFEKKIEELSNENSRLKHNIINNVSNNNNIGSLSVGNINNNNTINVEGLDEDAIEQLKVLANLLKKQK